MKEIFNKFLNHNEAMYSIDLLVAGWFGDTGVHCTDWFVDAGVQTGL